jgi:hypothetical protein
MRNRSGARGRPRAPVPVAKSGFDSKRFAPRRIARSPRPTVGYGVHRVFKVAASFLAEPGLPRAITAAVHPACRKNHREMGGDARAKSWVWAFHLPSGRSPPRLRASARLRGPSLGPCAQAVKQSANTTLLTFDAGFPDTFQSVGPAGRPTELPLLGLSKDRPSVVLPPPKSTPGTPARGLPSGRAGQSPSMFRPRGFPPPRRLAPSMTRACLATRSRPWGSPRFSTSPASRLAKPAPPRNAFPALRSLPSVRSRHLSGLPSRERERRPAI